ncbi:MAG TPA: hypothetical protein VI893_00135, partial [Thermoplasmata archaeon]|nr:hypothetical protein [Thermoplasmata archaeon]
EKKDAEVESAMEKAKSEIAVERDRARQALEAKQAELERTIEMERERAKLEAGNAAAVADKEAESRTRRAMEEEWKTRESGLRAEAAAAFKEREAELRRELDERARMADEERKRLLEAELVRMDEAATAKLTVQFIERENLVKERLEKESEVRHAALKVDMEKQLAKDADNARMMIELEYKRREEQIRKAIEEETAKKLEEMRKKFEQEFGRTSIAGVKVGTLPKEVYPFTAIVGQERMKRALILGAINPDFGGVLLWGEQGNGKKTGMIGLAQLLGEMKKADGTAPRTWDDPERYLSVVLPSAKSYLVGFVDTDLMFASLNYTRRDPVEAQVKISVESIDKQHIALLESAAQMTVHLEVTAPEDGGMRVELVKRMTEFRRDPKAFRKNYERDEAELRNRIQKARDKLPKVGVPGKVLAKIAQVGTNAPAKFDVLVAELARTHAAFEGRESVIIEDVQEAADLILAHRMGDEIMRRLKE